MTSHCNRTVNIGESERWASGIAGGLLLACGLRNVSSFTGVGLLAVGGGLLYRAVSGNCALYRALGIDRSSMDQRPEDPMDVSSEDSFPASDPPAWTSAAASRSGAAQGSG